MGISIKNYLRPNITNISGTIGVATFLWIKELAAPTLPNVTAHTIIEGLPPQLSIWLTLIITLASGYMLFLFTEKFNFAQNRTFLPFLLYILFSSSQPDFFVFSSGKIAFLLLLLSIWEILSTYHKHEPTKKIFNASLLLTISILIVPDYIILIPFLFISVYIINNLSLRILLAIGIGIIAPIIFLGELFYLLDTFQENAYHFFQAYQINIPDWGSDKVYIIYHAALFVLSFVVLREFLINRFQSNINERKNIQVMLWLYFFTSLTIILRMGQGTETSTAFSGTISFLFALYFTLNTTFKSTLFFFFFITAFIAYNMLFSYGWISLMG
jgi:hypothetical protein